ncbi:class I adenylate-forming enzyme family protein [Bythopirellula polymerisocia]|uniref:Long-chain-fatty-acid--CoA ligase n=1 Tax=Bythopirellula polymerisocia TaxID=2528003 RepID=A0A5C6CNE1_9BACT|nr:class I adenylate-forming enzyme family protein [Bythopirellula polymerisocia]TWU26040.1 Long-chain-fatty-acid--CoA ligase [Bythopirellula polymerisocia]
MTNLYQVLKATVQRQPAHIAVSDCENYSSVTYAQLLGRIDGLAKRLQAAGIGPGSCVGLHAASGLNYMIRTYALWKLGACVVPIPLELAPREKRQICQRIAIDTIVSSDRAIGFLSGIEATEVAQSGSCRVIRITPLRAHPVDFGSVNAAFIRFSSGTTGAAKGVVLSHETIFDRVHAANAGLRLTPDDRVVWLLSMAYHFAVSIVAYLTFGSTIILHKRAIDLGRALVEDTAVQRGTVIYGSPSHYELMARERSGRQLEDLRLAISTATALSAETAQAFKDRFDVPLTQAYGIIEIGLPCVNLLHSGKKLDSVGRPLPSFDLRLVDGNHFGGMSSIGFRGKGFLDAYYEPWQPRSEIMQDGWFYTGDLGEIDSEGSLYIRGRASEMINVGGMKFFPREVEEVLNSHPAIDEAVVFAVRKGNSREFACAKVVPRPDSRVVPTSVELRQFCAKRLAHFKVPQEVEFVTSLERTGSGKIVRTAVVTEIQAT